MSEWLAIWGVAQAAGFVFKPILEDLVKEGARDFGKDFLYKFTGFRAVKKVEFHLNAQQKPIQSENQEHCAPVN